MKTFAKRLKQARMNAGFRSAESFAGIVGIEPHTYRKYERGQSEPNFEILMRICENLNIPTSQLLPLEVEDKKRPARGQAAAA